MFLTRKGVQVPCNTAMTWILSPHLGAAGGKFHTNTVRRFIHAATGASASTQATSNPTFYLRNCYHPTFLQQEGYAV